MSQARTKGGGWMTWRAASAIRSASCIPYCLMICDLKPSGDFTSEPGTKGGGRMTWRPATAIGS